MTDLDPDLVSVTCPECGATASVRAGRRTASDFCPSCDYPLFWARPQVAEAAPDQTDDARWRAPGVSGASSTASLACPECAELNVPTATHCVRCGAAMTPPPPPPEPPPPPPVVVVQAPPERILVPCSHLPTWLVVLLTALVTIPLTLLVVWLL